MGYGIVALQRIYGNRMHRKHTDVACNPETLQMCLCSTQLSSPAAHIDISEDRNQ